MTQGRSDRGPHCGSESGRTPKLASRGLAATPQMQQIPTHAHPLPQVKSSDMFSLLLLPAPPYPEPTTASPEWSLATLCSCTGTGSVQCSLPICVFLISLVLCWQNRTAVSDTEQLPRAGLG